MSHWRASSPCSGTSFRLERGLWQTGSDAGLGVSRVFSFSVEHLPRRHAKSTRRLLCSAMPESGGMERVPGVVQSGPTGLEALFEAAELLMDGRLDSFGHEIRR